MAAAADGKEALEMAVDLRPDLILLDVVMPGMDGFSTCRKLKENPDTAGIPVIFVTSLDNPEDKLEGFSAGGVDYVTKPFHAGEIRARVLTQLRIRSLERRLRRQFAAGESEANEAQKNFLSLVEHTSDILVCAEQDDTVRLLNPAWHELTKTPESAVFGRLFPDLLHPGDREPVARALANAKKHHLVHARFDVRLPVPGGIRWMRASLHFSYDDEGECSGWSATLTDVGDLFDRLDTLKKSRDAVHVSGASRIEALQDAAQSLREPLFALNTAIGDLRAAQLSPEQSQALLALTRRSQEMNDKTAYLLGLFAAGQESHVAREKSATTDPLPAKSFDVPVLVADDSPINLRILVHLLRRCGFRDISSATHGQEARELYRLKKHDLVLLDCQMPVMDGYQACQEILALSGGHPPTILAVSAAALEENRSKAIDAGFNMLLAKPLTSARLREALASYGWRISSSADADR